MTNPTDPDYDKDGLSNGEEYVLGTNPFGEGNAIDIEVKHAVDLSGQGW